MCSTIAINNFAGVIRLDRIIKLQSIIDPNTRDPHVHKNAISFIGDRVGCANGVAAFDNNWVETTLSVDVRGLL